MDVDGWRFRHELLREVARSSRRPRAAFCTHRSRIAMVRVMAAKRRIGLGRPLYAQAESFVATRLSDTSRGRPGAVGGVAPG